MAPQPPAPPPKTGLSIGSVLGTLFSLAIALGALGAAGYLAYSEGWLALPDPERIDAAVPSADAGTPADAATGDGAAGLSR